MGGAGRFADHRARRVINISGPGKRSLSSSACKALGQMRRMVPVSGVEPEKPFLHLQTMT